MPQSIQVEKDNTRTKRFRGKVPLNSLIYVYVYKRRERDGDRERESSDYDILTYSDSQNMT